MREFNDVSGSFTRMREDGYFPFVQAQYLLCQSHANAVAGCHIFVFATVEELEQVLFVLVRHAHTVVRKADDGPFFPERNLDKRSLVPGVLAIVFDEVYERCCKQVTITDCCEHLVIFSFLLEYEFHMEIGVRPQDKFPCIEQQFVQTDFFSFDLFRFIIRFGKVQ